ncbi:CotO family spore coat protein [Bacillus cytotoxicus]|uniref:Spore coat protein CotO n=2 Tax=Bacillus cytotoxicus TaxID=580165 RepID=A0AAX2CDV5_9BACI|nr:MULTISPECIES: CotO family spore coat protein [Bacillus cereus group]KMT50445.1 hypothetical protein TU51_05395 [Bacillus cytotoxicus]MDH2859401.1 CotO family spore coat protein [Bacillus cytotoxicus]MDH2864151.1 CotO family spore coat protein [Bacillus cytotoxicus]MDH2867287.1 CotO family spore coat protein [Bacillus cytotoxicus]MDH2871706.1 CotO family spore coat protein [Bacillus cytotoxicus]
MSRRKKERTPYPTLYTTQPDFSEKKWNLQKTFVIKKEDENLRIEKIRREIAEAKRASKEKAMQVSNEKSTARNEENKNADLIVASEELAEAASSLSEQKGSKQKEWPQSVEGKNEAKEYEASKKHIKRKEAEKEDTFHQMEKEREVNMYGDPPQIEEQVRNEREAENIEIEQSEGIDRGQKRERSKSFKDMDNEEKILFLIDRPHYIASIRCQIKTKQDVFTGYVRAYEGGEVLLEVKRAQETFNRLMPRELRIPIDEIISIRMMAF